MPNFESNKRSHPEDLKFAMNKRVRKIMKMAERKQKMETLSAKVTRNPVILEQIFSHLPPSDIKTVALVDRTWNSVVEQPRYWTWVNSRKAGWMVKKNFAMVLAP